MKPRLPSLLAFLLALLLYVAALPRLALWLDRQIALIWRLPTWIEPLAGFLILAGTALATWSFWTFTFHSNGGSAPLVPATGAAVSHGLRCSRDSLILGSWMLGAGLGLLLRSVSLMVFVAVAAMVASGYVHRAEKTRKLSRIAEGWKGYARHPPSWLTVVLVILGTLAGLPAVTHSAPAPRVTEPAILVQIRCKPGTAELWRKDFEQHIRPAIEEAVSRGDGYTSFQFLQPALPGQAFDFALLYTGKTYAGLDQPRIPPQYLVLLEREGTVRTLATVREMSAWEDQVTVSLVHLSRTR